MQRNSTKPLADKSCNLPLEKLKWEAEEGHPKSTGAESLARILFFTL